MTKHIFTKIAIFASAILLSLGAQAQPGSFSYVDMAVSSTRKAYNPISPEQSNIWLKKEHDCQGTLNPNAVKAFGGVSKFSQSNLEAMAKSNFRISNQLISTIEGQFFKPKFVKEDNGYQSITCLTGMNIPQGDLNNNYLDYFKTVKGQLRYLLSKQKTKHIAGTKSYQYEILKNGAQLKEVLADPTRLGILLSIKGGHCLGDYSHIVSGTTGTAEYEQIVLRNIDKLKGILPLEDLTNDFLEYPVFSFSLDNYFDDGLGGKPLKFSETEEKIFGVQPGLNSPLTPLGEKVLKKMVEPEGRRILVDVSGMTLSARQWYYEHLKNFKMIGDTVPIIATHVAISGLAWNSDEYLAADNAKKNENSWLNNLTSSLSRQDVLAIYQSGGLIGISLSKNKLLNGTRFEKEFAKTVEGSAQQREVAVKALVANMCKIVHIVQQPNAWDIISVSSEFDDMTLSFPSYSSCSDLTALARDLKAFLENPTDIYDLYKASEIKEYMLGLSADEIVSKVMSSNALNFLSINLGKKLGKSGETANGGK